MLDVGMLLVFSWVAEEEKGLSRDYVLHADKLIL